MVPAESLPWITTTSSLSVDGRSIAARNTLATISHGTWATTLLSPEWGTPNMVENGVNPELLLGGKYGHNIHIWDLRKRRHLQSLDLGAEQQMVLELRPAHDPTKAYGFAGVVTSLKDLSSSIWLWHRPKGSNGGSNGKFEIKKVIEIPAEPAEASQLPPLLQGFKAVPPLLTDINLSVDDRFLYASCWGTGDTLPAWGRPSARSDRFPRRAGVRQRCLPETQKHTAA